MNMRVLVVEDDPDQVIIRCMLLAHHGFETRRAGDPVAALKAIREDVPDIVVVDLGLPAEQDGLQLIRELKRSFPSVVVVVLTGSNVQRLKSNPELQDVADVIEKGTSCKTLLGSLDRIVASRQAST
jgi:DNA-binding NtrC family response regulator